MATGNKTLHLKLKILWIAVVSCGYNGVCLLIAASALCALLRNGHTNVFIIIPNETTEIICF